MYVEFVPNRKSPPAVLLRECWREDGRVRKRTLANLSGWPRSKIEALQAVLRDEKLVAPQECFAIRRSAPYGHVRAVLGMIRKLGLDALIDPHPSRTRNLVVAMIAERLLHPGSKLATTRLWEVTTLAADMAVTGTDVDELYAALDWLLQRQSRIEGKLARRHLTTGATVLYDVSSSYYEGRTCPLARYGHNRDENGLPIIVYGVLTDSSGRPLAVDVYPGNTADPNTIADQVAKLRNRFDLEQVVLVGDRGMLTQTRIDELRKHPGLGWISALRSVQIKGLVASGTLQLSLFDEQNLAEIRAPEEYPGERLIACYNPLLAEDRRRTREELLTLTEQDLTKISREVVRRKRTPLSEAEIGLKVGKIRSRYKMAKHLTITIRAGSLTWQRNEESIRQEAALDGIYVLRTSEPEGRLSAAAVVRNYKNLSQVERVFRILKGIDLRVRPIYHRLEDHVRAHIFLCLLAYYVEWHMRQALAPLLFADEQLPADRWQRDPVKPAPASIGARIKKARRQTADGLVVHSFETLLEELGTQCRNECAVQNDVNGPVMQRVTETTPIQKRAFELLGIGCTQ